MTCAEIFLAVLLLSGLAALAAYHLGISRGLELALASECEPIDYADIRRAKERMGTKGWMV